MKQCSSGYWTKAETYNLKRQEPRLRDWNCNSAGWRYRVSSLKRQEPRLRDWNYDDDMLRVITPETWNDKNLDYEIETNRLCRDERRHGTWNDKNLDYEIETQTKGHNTAIGTGDLKRQEPRLRDWNMLKCQFPNAIHIRLETTRTSITRLKLREVIGIHWNNIYPWNDKNLDYEIETWERACLGLKCRPWNDKNLDYEIETFGTSHVHPRKACLKRQEPRLRDWNLSLGFQRKQSTQLETTRTSITRLKRRTNTSALSASVSWNDKNLDYEIETRRMTSVPLSYRHLKRQEPRLRDWNRVRGFWKGDPPCAWNDKNLDYEIETSLYR